MTDPSRFPRLQLAVLRDAGFPLRAGAKVLDFGCGNGSLVYGWLEMGFDAHGCDLRFKSGPEVENLQNAGRIRLIPLSPYRLPYPDASFDAVFTNTVMEHVRDYPATLAEIRRVLKSGSVSLHMFPARGRPLEPHIFVPLGTIIQNRLWLMLWAFLGVRKESQKGKSWQIVAEENYAYLKSSTNYLRGGAIEKHFRGSFGEVLYVERSFLKSSFNRRGRRLYRWGQKLPGLFLLYRTLWARVILARP